MHAFENSAEANQVDADHHEVYHHESCSQILPLALLVEIVLDE